MVQEKKLSGAERLMQIETEQKDAARIQREVATAKKESFKAAMIEIRLNVLDAVAREHNTFNAVPRRSELNPINDRQTLKGTVPSASRMEPFASLNFLRGNDTYGWVVFAVDIHGSSPKVRILAGTTLKSDDKYLNYDEFESFDPVSDGPVTQNWIDDALIRAIESLA